MLPSLANVLAIYDEDERRLQGVEHRLSASSAWPIVTCPRPGWVAALDPLPGSPTEPGEFTARPLIFAEGEDQLIGPSGGHAGRTEQIVTLVDGHPDRLRSLPGDFGFVRLGERGKAAVVRSCGGLAPFYVSSTGGRVVISTHLQRMVPFLSEPARADAFVHAVWTSGFGWFPERRAPVEGVEVVPPGHVAVLTPGRPTRWVRYWDPQLDDLPRPTPQRFGEHAKRLRSLLLAALDRDLDHSGVNLLSLSGGVDSSALAVLTSEVLGLRLATLSFEPPPTMSEEHARNAAYIDALLTRLPIEEARRMPLTTRTRLALLVTAPPSVLPAIHPVLGALGDGIVESPATVYLGGEFADDICGSHTHTFDDWTHATSPLGLWRARRRLPTGRRDVLRWGRRRVEWAARRPRIPYPEELPDFVHLALQEEYREWRAGFRRRLASERRTRPLLELWHAQDGWLAMNWEAASTLRLRRSLPFMTREMLELAYECHPHELIGPGAKRLLRAALRHGVPGLFLDRSDKGTSRAGDEDDRLAWVTVPEATAGVLRPQLRDDPPATTDLVTATKLAQLRVAGEALEHVRPA